jgi:hypothetical protein
MARFVRNYRYDLLRQGDTYLSRSRRVKSAVIIYASFWGKGREGRRRARRAVRDDRTPNHGGNVQDNHGQKYPVEAGIRGYEQNSFDDYRSRRCYIVRVFRWSGFDDPEKRELSARVLELWSRRTRRVRYDLWGAFMSSRLGRFLFGRWMRNDPNRLFCTEGSLYLHVICGLLGYTLAYDTKLSEVRRLVEAHKSELPPTANPIDLMDWMERHEDFTEVRGFVA